MHEVQKVGADGRIGTLLIQALTVGFSQYSQRTELSISKLRTMPRDQKFRSFTAVKSLESFLGFSSFSMQIQLEK